MSILYTAMKFTNLIILMIASTVAATSRFSLLTIRAGSVYQYQFIGFSDGNLVLQGDNRVTFQLNDDNSLYDTLTERYISLSEGSYVESVTPDNNFSLQNGYLVHGADGFYACSDGGVMKLTTTCGTEGAPIALSSRPEADIDF